MSDYLIFGDVDTRDYGVAVFDMNTDTSPTRTYEKFTVPGRDGDLLRTNSRLENKTMQYMGIIYENFEERLIAFRDALMGQKGYKRLSDSIHEGEFCYGMYAGPFNPKIPKGRDMGKFMIEFSCKPQRYLVEGENPVEIGQWGETTTVQGDVVTFDAPEGTGFKSLVVDIELVQSGTGDPSPSNVRPITGHNSVNVTRAGKNMLHNSLSTTTKQGLTYTVNSDGSVTVTGTATTNSYVAIPINRVFDVDVVISGSPSMTGIYGQIVTSGGNVSDTGSGATITAGTTITEYRCRINNGVNPNGATFYPMLRLAYDTDATFEPYTGTTYPVSFGSAGTVYGGTVDVVSGVLTVDTVTAQIGSYNWTDRIGSQGRVYTLATNILPSAPYVYDSFASLSSDGKNLCDKLPMTNTASNPDSASITIGVNEYIYINGVTHIDSSVTDKTSLNTWLTNNPLQVTFRLATPQTYQLTPAQVEALLGVNNIWSDAGDVTVEYGAAPGLMINPTMQTARPLIRVYGYGTVVVGAETITIAQYNKPYVDIDCDVMDCYYNADNLNAYVSFQSHEFPTLHAEITGITYSGSITKVEVIPRWWRA